MGTWFQTNKVILLTTLMAVLMTVQQLVDTVTDWRIIGLAAVISGLGILSKNLRGQWPGIITAIIAAGNIIQASIATGNKISWTSIIVSLGIAVIGVFLPPAKSLSYEKSPEIVAAKQQAASIDASKTPPVSPPVSGE